LNLKCVVGLSLLSAFVLMRLFASLPLVLFALLPFSFFVGAALTVWFLYETVSKWSEFNQTIAWTAMVFVPISVFIILPLIVNGTPANLRSGLGPFNISLTFLFWLGLSQLIFLIPASLIIWFYPD